MKALFFAAFSALALAQVPLPSPQSGGSGGGGGGTGTVTSVDTTGPITGGPFTTTGTIACATCVTSPAALTSTAIVTGGGLQASQTPSATTTLDSSGNFSTQGTISTGVGGSIAGASDMGAGTSAAIGANKFGWGAGATMTTSVRLESPNAVPSANTVMLFGAPTSNKATWAYTGISGSGSFCMTTSCSMTTPALGTPSAVVLTNATGLPSAQVPAVALTSGTSITMSNAARFFECTSTCTITVPVPSAGVQYCVRNANNVSTVITFAAIGSSARYENTASTAYGTAGTGTLVSGGAVGDKICLVGLDATHYDVFSYAGTWVVN